MPVTRTERCIASKLPGLEATDAVLYLFLRRMVGL